MCIKVHLREVMEEGAVGLWKWGGANVTNVWGDLWLPGAHPHPL